MGHTCFQLSSLQMHFRESCKTCIEDPVIVRIVLAFGDGAVQGDTKARGSSTYCSGCLSPLSMYVALVHRELGTSVSLRRRASEIHCPWNPLCERSVHVAINFLLNHSHRSTGDLAPRWQDCDTLSKHEQSHGAALDYVEPLNVAMQRNSCDSKSLSQDLL